MLSEKEKLDYLYNVVIPVYAPLEQLDCRMAILDHNAHFCWMSEALRRFIGIDAEMLNSRYDHTTIPISFIEQFIAHHNISLEHFLIGMNKVNTIIKKVIEFKRPVYFVMLLPLHRSFQGYGRAAIPIVHPSGEIVGVQVTGYKFSFFGMQEFISLLNSGSFEQKEFHPESSCTTKFYRELKLSPRQKEVMFLVSQGISQDYAAQILGIKRGTLSKIISDQICPKFNIFPPHYLKLLSIAKEQGLDKIIPETFWKPFVFEYQS